MVEYPSHDGEGCGEREEKQLHLAQEPLSLCRLALAVCQAVTQQSVSSEPNLIT